MSQYNCEEFKYSKQTTKVYKFSQLAILFSTKLLKINNPACLEYLFEHVFLHLSLLHPHCVLVQIDQLGEKSVTNT